MTTYTIYHADFASSLHIVCRKTLTRQYWHSAFIRTTRFIALELVAQLWRSISSGRKSTADTITDSQWLVVGGLLVTVSYTSHTTAVLHCDDSVPPLCSQNYVKYFRLVCLRLVGVRFFSVIQANRCVTRSPAIAEGPRDAPCQLKLRKMSHKCSSNCIW